MPGYSALEYRPLLLICITAAMLSPSCERTGGRGKAPVSTQSSKKGPTMRT